jgi:hypothetical protein
MTPHKDVIISQIRCLDIRYNIEIECPYKIYKLGQGLLYRVFKLNMSENTIV